MSEPARGRRPLIVLYNRFWTRPPDLDELERASGCEVAADRTRLAEAHAVVFHLPTLEGIDRVEKAPGQVWVARSMESDVTCPRLADRELMRRFDLTMTYRRDATVWTPYFGPAVADALLRPTGPKPEASPAVYLQSSRVNASGRVQFVGELMKRVKVDSYGAVLNNRAWPIPDGGSAAKLELIGRYKFSLAFENSIARDYVTEKFFDPLIAGSVPVYLGAPNVADFAPAPHCYIDARDFDGPAALAAHLNDLAADEPAYAQYLAWKRHGLSPRFLALVQEVTPHPFARLGVHLRARAAREAPSESRESG